MHLHRKYEPHFKNRMSAGFKLSIHHSTGSSILSGVPRRLKGFKPFHTCKEKRDCVVLGLVTPAKPGMMIEIQKKSSKIVPPPTSGGIDKSLKMVFFIQTSCTIVWGFALRNNRNTLTPL
uniref:Uncharacterized protein n=1 Tax=Eutreptiella gymnastica TaxID=73025 RepID=A0A7S1NU79_9EUGL|mmetsp:Transcript_90552/g.156902  ORF Transcript_90552/g.156902 Transcript_90552/m.156902 type:complete len:120 (+) Transcript_90552:724-1083(+)